MAFEDRVATMSVEDRLKEIRDGVFSPDNDCKADQPGNKDLLKLLDDYFGDKTFRDTKLTSDEKDRLVKFVDGSKAVDAGKDFVIPRSIGVRDELEPFHQVNKAIITQAMALFHPPTESHLASVTKVNGHTKIELDGEAEHGFTKFVHTLCSFLSQEEHEDEIKVWDNVEFSNWGRTVEFTPRYTVWPKTVAGVANIVKYAVEHDMSVRCAGYRHSWSPIFGKSGQILLSMLDPDTVGKLPNTLSLPFIEGDPTELETIDIVPPGALDVTPGKTLVRVGAACTNERLRRWCIANKKVTLPCNVIMVEITLGGSNAPICHGAGRQHGTLSDLVRCIEYIDCKGKLQVVSDKEQLRAAAGAFGMLGVVTHITMEFDAMSYAQLAPKIQPCAIAIPPPDGYEIPPTLRIDRTPEERQQDIATFEKNCESKYYSEWFWFPYHDKIWVNVWDTTEDATDVVDFPNAVQIFVQWVSTVLFNVAQYSGIFDEIGRLIGKDFTATTLIAKSAMGILGERQVKTYVPDGLHFQRAIQNVRVRDMEVELAVPPKAGSSTETDWTVCRRAWWDAMLTAYKWSKTAPQVMPLEMRIMGDSDILLSPQRGNKFGTCSIEVLTLEIERKQWLRYSQEILDKWTSYTDSAGKPLKVSPHWAKEWANHSVDGKAWKDVLKEEHREQAKEFRSTLEEIGGKQGWTIEDLRQRFGNDTLNELFLQA